MCLLEEMLYDVVIMNSWVKFCNFSDGEVCVCMLVYLVKMIDSNIQFFVMVLVGVVLLGLCVGDFIYWEFLGGVVIYFEVLEFEYQLEVVGDYLF